MPDSNNSKPGRQDESLEIDVNAAWDEGMAFWGRPSIPRVIAPATLEEMNEMGEYGKALVKNLAFMRMDNFQTYLNTIKIAEEIAGDSQSAEDLQRAISAVSKHEIGHRFCPYDKITLILLEHLSQKAMKGESLPYSIKAASRTMGNIFTDECINTTAARKRDEDIPWAYQQLSKGKEGKKFWRVYGRSMELAWGKEILPQGVKLEREEEEAARQVAQLFERDYWHTRFWKEKIGPFSKIMCKFLETEEGDGEAAMDDAMDNVPEEIDEETARELAKRLAEIGNDGLPANPEGLKDFQDIMGKKGGTGMGSPLEASISFYDMLSESFNVVFAKKPFGRPRENPFQPRKWQPSMSADKLDVDYSVLVGGRIIPGLNTYYWKSKRTQKHGGLEEVMPDLDLYLDSSMSMTNPLKEISLAVLASFVAVKKARQLKAGIRVTNFSSKEQCETTEYDGSDIMPVYKTITKFYSGGTVFPCSALKSGRSPRQVLIITDSFFNNVDEAAKAIEEYVNARPGNKVSVYAIDTSPDSDVLRKAGAEVIEGTTPQQIFKHVVGKADEIYTKLLEDL